MPIKSKYNTIPTINMLAWKLGDSMSYGIFYKNLVRFVIG